MMNFNKDEINLCKQLHELGVRKELKCGDWVLITFDRLGEAVTLFDTAWTECPNRFPAGVPHSGSALYSCSTDEYYKEYFPLWQIHDCISWLREKGFEQGDLHWDENLRHKKTASAYIEKADNKGMFVEDKCEFATTPLEALLKAMIAIAKENPNA